MANAPVGPRVVFLVIMLLQQADATILKAGGTSPIDDILVNKMIDKRAKIIYSND